MFMKVDVLKISKIDMINGWELIQTCIRKTQKETSRRKFKSECSYLYSWQGEEQIEWEGRSDRVDQAVGIQNELLL